MKTFTRRFLRSATFASLLFVAPAMLRAQTFTNTGSMNYQRYGQKATLLNNGTVLIAGGSTTVTTDTWIPEAEIYNPATGLFSLTGSLNTARDFPTATMLDNGMVLITGGYNYYAGGYLSSAELYNPATGTFTLTGSMTTARLYHTATLLNNGMVLVAGGVNSGGYLASAELYNPATGTFSATGNLNHARAYQTATLLSNEIVLITGGFNGASVLGSAELYNPATGAFSSTGSMNYVRYGQSATLLGNGTVLIAGGSTTTNTETWIPEAEIYNPASGLFTVTGNLNTARDFPSATLHPSGLVLIAGGYNYFAGGWLNSAELYDPTTGTFTVTGAMNARRIYQTATLLANGSVLMTGGESTGYSVLSSAEFYQMPYAEFLPPYQILSVLYAAPGNASSNGFMNTTSYGTTTSVGQQFQAGTQITFTITGPFGITCCTTAFGFTTATGSSQSFQETYSQGSGSAVVSVKNPVDHTQDQFFLFLNPMVTVTQTSLSSAV